MLRRCFESSLLLVLTLGGCSADVDTEIPDEVEIKGRMYDRVDLDDFAFSIPATAAAPDDVGAGLVWELGEDEDPISLLDFSREELAHALRPVLMRGNEAYLAREPDWDAADAVLSGPGQPVSRDWVPRPDDDRAGPLNRTEFRAVLGPDGRVLSDTTQFPWSAITKVNVFDTGFFMGPCTGSFVGPYTFLISAHCLMKPNPSGGWYAMDSMTFYPGRQGSYTPHTYSCDIDDPWPSNDFYNWGYPAGFLSSGGTANNNPFDYAVIDVWPCFSTGAPAFFSSYSVNAPDAMFGVYGYPYDSCPGQSGAYNQCGQVGSGYRNDWRMETEFIDSTAGHSGGPWYRTDTMQVAAITQGYRTYWDLFRCGFDQCKRNYGRRIDGSVDSFIRSISWDW